MNRKLFLNYFALLLIGLISLPSLSDSLSRARDIGIPFEGVTGSLNAITDVRGVKVGHKSVIHDLPNNKAARTGVTAILPRGEKTLHQPVFAGWFSLNGNGEMTGTTWIEESGFLEGPVVLTNTHSVGVVHDALIRWRVAKSDPDTSGYWWSLPVVAETWDGYLNDINGFHVKSEHVFEALESASGGVIVEGNVGSGTGMICHKFKCGIGTSSRVIEINNHKYTVGVLVQANYGDREKLRIGGLPVGLLLTEKADATILGAIPKEAHSSIIIVIATDAPLIPHQLKAIAKRASLGLARVGSIASNSSGDIFIAFSIANNLFDGSNKKISMIANNELTGLFGATVNATEEAIVNALIAGRDMTGNLGHTVKAIDHSLLRDILRQHNRLIE